jgi:hypothetical protein
MFQNFGLALAVSRKLTDFAIKLSFPKRASASQSDARQKERKAEAIRTLLRQRFQQTQNSVATMRFQSLATRAHGPMD